MNRIKQIKFSGIARSAIKFLFLTIILVLLFLPLVALLGMSFKPDEDLMFNVGSLFPSKFTFKNYIEIFNLQGAVELNLFRAIGNTVFITFFMVIGVTFTSIFCGYGFTRFRVRLNNILFALFFGCAMIPGQVLQIPIYELYYNLGFIDTYYPFIIPAFTGGGIFNIFLVKQFMRNFPKGMFESAQIDGAGEFRIFLSFAIPLSVPVMIVIGIFTFLNGWNDFAGPLIYLNTTEKYTLALAIYQFTADFNRYTGSTSVNMPWNLVAAMSVISMLPILLLYSFGQKYFMEGISLGSEKG